MTATKATKAPAEPIPVALDRRAQAAVRALRELKAQADEISRKITEKEKIIKQAMGTSETATVGGLAVATWKTAYRGSVDMTKLKENYPSEVAACIVQKPVRTFKLLSDV